MLSESALREFKRLWEKHNPGESIDDQRLLALASKVLRAVELLYDDTENVTLEQR